MAKGKKFDAAEKHFEKKCVVWRKKIRELEQIKNEYHDRVMELSNKVEKLQIENDELKKSNVILMELKNITTEEVRALIKSKESVNRLAEMLGVMNKEVIKWNI